MRTSFVSFALLAQLACVLASKYHVHTENPNAFIVSTGFEKSGDPVVTLPFPGIDTIVDVTPPVSRISTLGEVAGKTIGRNKPLYVGLSRNDKIEWQHSPYKWEFSAEGPFHVVSIRGTNYIWAENRGRVELQRAVKKDSRSELWVFEKA